MHKSIHLKDKQLTCMLLHILVKVCFGHRFGFPERDFKEEANLNVQQCIYIPPSESFFKKVICDCECETKSSFRLIIMTIA